MMMWPSVTIASNQELDRWMFLENTGDRQTEVVDLFNSSPLLSHVLIDEKKMTSSAYEKVVIGKLKLKGDPLSVKGGDKTLKRKKKTRSLFTGSGEERDINEVEDGMGRCGWTMDDRLTAAERRYLEQRERIEMKRLGKMATKSHRDRIQEFNQYLANLSEHYDIPKVGPG